MTKAKTKKTTKTNKKTSTAKPKNTDAETPKSYKLTVSHLLGEMTWLMTQSPIHKQAKIADMEWMVLPALMLEQFRVFRDGSQPLGYITWAYLTPEAEEKLNNEGRIGPTEWRASGMDTAHLKGSPLAELAEENTTGDEGALWIVDMVAPTATVENKLVERMFADLINGPFEGKAFKFHKIDSGTDKRVIIEITKEQTTKVKT